MFIKIIKIMGYDKHYQRQKQSLFFPGPIDPKTGNYTHSPATKEGVKQFPRTKAEKQKLENFYRRHGLGL
jgi:hypothetical protein